MQKEAFPGKPNISLEAVGLKKPIGATGYQGTMATTAGTAIRG